MRYRSCCNDIVLIPAEKEDIQNFKEPERIYYKKDDKPYFLVVPGSMPESDAFPYERPNSEQEERGDNNATKSRAIEKIQLAHAVYANRLG